jgi:hypothetical protein
MKFGTHVAVPEPILTAYYMNSSRQCVSVCVFTCIVARQRLGRDIHAPTMERLLEASFSPRSMSYQRRACGSVCIPPVVATQWLGKDVPTAKNNCWGHR